MSISSLKKVVLSLFLDACFHIKICSFKPINFSGIIIGKNKGIIKHTKKEIYLKISFIYVNFLLKKI